MEFYKHLINKSSIVLEALARLDELSLDAVLFVVNDDGVLLGSLTDGDIRRALMKGLDVNEKVINVCNCNPRIIFKGERDIEKVIALRGKNLKIIPIVDSERKVVNVINFRKHKSYLPVDAVIMAGGRGERLRPLTDKIPKPLLKVGNKPILEHIIDRLQSFGIDDFWITLRYMGKDIENYFGNGHSKNIYIQYVYEEEALGTIGAISNIKNFRHDYILVSNSDLLTNIDYELFFLNFLSKEADFSVVTIPYSVDIPYAVLETNNGHIINFREKPTYTYYSNGGIYLMKKEITSFLPKNTYFNTTDLMELLIKSGKIVVSYPMVGYWLDIGRPEDYKKAEKDYADLNSFNKDIQ